MTARTLFMGSDPVALPLLRHFHERVDSPIEWAAVCTQPDRRSGRGMKLRANAIKTWALENGLPVWQPGRCGEDEVRALRDSGIELVIVMAYGQLLRPSFFEAPRLGTVNLHASLLPKLRGASPIHTAIATGEKQTGVTLMRIVKQLDAGPVADHETVPIHPEMAAAELVDAMAAACIPLLERTLPRLAAGQLSFREQDHDAATYCRIIEKGDACLDFRTSAPEVAARIRAFQPWPGAQVEHNGNRIRILKARALIQSGGDPGTVSGTGDGRLFIACGSGMLEIMKVQRAGGRPLGVAEFLRGYPLPDGTVFPSHELLPLVFDKPFFRKRN